MQTVYRVTEIASWIIGAPILVFFGFLMIFGDAIERWTESK